VINRCLGRSDLFRRKRAVRRHWQSESASDQPVIEEAVFATAGHDAAGAVLKDRTSPVEPQAVDLLRRSVTTKAVLPKDRQDITAKIDPGSSLEGLGG